jgi:hypothetical protein
MDRRPSDEGEVDESSKRLKTGVEQEFNEESKQNFETGLKQDSKQEFNLGFKQDSEFISKLDFNPVFNLGFSKPKVKKYRNTVGKNVLNDDDVMKNIFLEIIDPTF